MNILNHFERIINKFGEDGLSESFFEAASDNLEVICDLFNITKTQAALLAVIIENEPVEIGKLPKILNCKKIQLYQYMEDFDVLKSKKIILQKKQARFMRRDDPVYTVPMDVINTVRKGSEYKNKSYESPSPQDFFDNAEELLDACEDDDLDNEELIMELERLLEANKHINFSQKANEYDLKEGSITVLLIFCCALVNYDEEAITLSRINEVLGNTEARAIAKRFKSGEHKLIVNELIEPSNMNGLANTEYYRLTQKAKNEFLADIDLKKPIKHKGKNFILSQDISEKNLFYNDKIRNRIDELTRLLTADNFINIQNRLKESGMRTGFACIFSGSPGTGKTETVYQIAKKTGRDIYLVDISETKSMWFGESEKRIKALFDRYRGMVNYSKEEGSPAPILLFNEADAVLGRRQELSAGRSGPGQTENAIQNIILQEMENLDGILIATTNMTVNIDKAFERRFLYKIEFDKPDVVSKKLMWQSFMPSINEDHAVALAKKFDFSGGQIENITRKCTVSSILNGSMPDFTELEELCKEEVLEKAEMRIGFV